jgi:hypothetical protein
MKYIILLSLTFLISCGVKEEKFNKSTWNKRDDIFYANRESMINDLMKNYLRKGMSYAELVELIGQPENYVNMKPYSIGYEIMVDYGSDIDPVKGKKLLFTLSKDSTIIRYKLEKWGY